VRRGDEFITIPRRRVRALLFRLALDLQPVAREHLALLLWANVDTAAAHRDLSHLLTHLRDALPDHDCLQSEADYVCLRRDCVWSDTATVLELFHGRHQPGVDIDSPFPETHPTTHETLLQAASLYAGPLMDGFFLDDGCEFEEWLTVERAIWERRFRKIFELLEKSALTQDDIAAQMHLLRFAADQGELDVDDGQ
jgi:DNA-binding SARP family transcriptional activator